jgi:hypothetical protein
VAPALTSQVTRTMVFNVASPDAPTGVTFKKTPFHVEDMSPTKPIFKTRDIFELTGKVTDGAGGVVVAKSLNATTLTSDIKFSEQFDAKGPISFFNVSAKFGSVTLKGRAEAISFPGQPMEIAVFEWYCPSKTNPGQLCYIWQMGGNPPPPPPPPPPGTCKLYSAVTSHTSGEPATTESGFKGPAPAVTLWSSWPASSPWVTSVGATRFVGQEVGNPEMASDQFGSGGGFYPLFTTDGEFQAAAVKK